MRIVADTNTVISGLLWSGAPQQLINAARVRRIDLYTTAALTAELAEVIGRTKFVLRITAASLSAAELVADYAQLAHVVFPAKLPGTIILRDPDDDHVLACALAAQVDLIVTGDRDLLDLGVYGEIPIITAAEALTRLPQH